MLPEVPEPVHQGNVVQPRSFVGMSQNGGTAWSLGNVGWTYRQILSHYYSTSDPTVSSEVREKANRNGKRIGEQTFEHIKANPKDAQIAAVSAIDEMP